MAGFPPWQQGIQRTYEPLRGLHRADAVIVGGGLTGVTTAAMLSQAGLRVILLEARQLGIGATWGCLGTACCQTGQAYQTTNTPVNIEADKVHAQRRLSALDELRLFMQSFRVHCNACETDVYTYAFLERDLPALEAFVLAQQALGIPIDMAPDTGGCPFPVARCAVVRRQLRLSPLLYLMEMARLAEQSGCVIAERTPVRHIAGGAVQLDSGTVKAPVVIMATGAPAGCTQSTLLSMLHARNRTYRTLSGSMPVHEVFLSVRNGGLNLRPVPGGLLADWTLGRTGEDNRQRSELLERVLRGRLPEYAVTGEVLRQDIWSHDGLPMIGNIHTRHTNIFMATGYNGSGLIGSFLAAQMILRQLLGHSLPEDTLFQPHRRYEGRRSVSLNGMKPMLKARIRGVVRLRAPRCPHMGCRMRYNHAARRWECPCHGSSFSILGEVLDAPALHPAHVSAKDRPRT